jgi:hypothetical protein
MHPETDIVWLRDESGLFPRAIFSGDTDALTMGWCSFTAKSRDEVVLALLTGFEYSAGEAGIETALNRLSRELNRNDLVYIRVRYERVGPSGKGMSFLEFKKKYRPYKAHYSSRSGASEAVQVGEQSLREFVSRGGIVTVSSPNTSLERTRDR